VWRGGSGPEELGEHIDGVHRVLVLLVEDKVAEAPAVFGPGVFSRCFNKKERKKNGDKTTDYHSSSGHSRGNTFKLSHLAGVVIGLLWTQIHPVLEERK